MYVFYGFVFFRLWWFGDYWKIYLYGELWELFLKKKKMDEFLFEIEKGKSLWYLVFLGGYLFKY